MYDLFRIELQSERRHKWRHVTQWSVPGYRHLGFESLSENMSEQTYGGPLQIDVWLGGIKSCPYHRTVSLTVGETYI